MADGCDTSRLSMLPSVFASFVYICTSNSAATPTHTPCGCSTARRAPVKSPHERALGRRSGLAAVARHRVAVVQMRHLPHVELDSRPESMRSLRLPLLSIFSTVPSSRWPAFARDTEPSSVPGRPGEHALCVAVDRHALQPRGRNSALAALASDGQRVAFPSTRATRAYSPASSPIGLLPFV